MHTLRYFHQPPKTTTNTVVVTDNKAVQKVSAQLDTKVDKVEGRGLSQNSYSTTEKTKLRGVEEGALVNVLPDWDEEDITSDAYIKNKPTIQAGVTGVKGDAETTYRRGNVNLTATNIGLGNVANIDQSKAIKKITRSGTTFTYTCLDGSTGTFTQLDTDTTYSGSDTITLTDTTFSLTKKNVTTALGYTPPTLDTTYSGSSTVTLTDNVFSLTKKNVTTALGYTPAEEGASGDYLPLSGGTLTGKLTTRLVSAKEIMSLYKPLWFYDDDIHVAETLIYNLSDYKAFEINAKTGFDLALGAGNNRCVYIKEDHNVGISVKQPSYKLHVGGTVGGHSFVNTSDIRDKNIIQQYNIPITTIAQAPAFAFTWKNNEEDSSTHVGSSAQYWKEVVPEAVKTSDDDKGTLSMLYDVLALLSSINIAKTVLEMQNKIDTLEKRILQLEQAASK